jgi:hypothetical protein
MRCGAGITTGSAFRHGPEWWLADRPLPEEDSKRTLRRKRNAYLRRGWPTALGIPVSDFSFEDTMLALVMGLLSYLQKNGTVDVGDLENHLSNFVIREEFKIDDDAMNYISMVLWDVRKLQ